jgi:hypothetical protein
MMQTASASNEKDYAYLLKERVAKDPMLSGLYDGSLSWADVIEMEEQSDSEWTTVSKSSGRKTMRPASAVPETTASVCRFFNTQRGCRNKSSCSYLHIRVH